jgi:type I restriction enzyme S subunit
MEVSKGFKRTEIGAIPEDWELEQLGVIAELTSSKRIFESDYVPSGIPFYRGKEISLLINKMSLEDEYFILEKKYDDIKKQFGAPQKGDILITAVGTLGNVYVVPSNDKFYFKDGNLIWLRNIKNTLPDYLAFQLRSRKSEIINNAIGSTQKALTIIVLKKTIIPLPSLPEQNAIIIAISDVDALLNSLDALIAKKRLIKQGAMQELLTGKKRLSGFSGEWEIVKFDDLADKNIKWSITGGPFGSNLKASDYVPDGVRIIQLQNIGDGVFHDDYAIYTSEKKANELISCNIYPGEIILSKMGDPVARACLVPMKDKRYLMASDGIRLVVDAKRFDKRFVFYYINSIYFRRKAIEASTGSTRQRIGLTDLRNLPFVAPSLPEQTAIAEILSDMDAEISALEQKREKTRLLKQGMMQELLTGRIRLI